MRMGLHRHRIKTTPTTADAEAGTSGARAAASCGCLRRLMRRVKKQGKQILYVRRRCECCNYNYDPRSYSLNFDSGSLVNDEDYYYQFCAFSSRYAAASAPAAGTSTTLLVASLH